MKGDLFGRSGCADNEATVLLQYETEYQRFRSFLMRNLKSREPIQMSRSLCSIFETSSNQSDYVAGKLLARAETQPNLKNALLKWHPTIYADSAWLASLKAHQVAILN